MDIIQTIGRVVSADKQDNKLKMSINTYYSLSPFLMPGVLNPILITAQ